jgi:hypothetical protein
MDGERCGGVAGTGGLVMNATETLTTLDGVWRGEGEGYLPNGDTFAYREHASFTADGSRRLVRYTFEDVIVGQDGRDERLSHIETGIIRVTDDGGIELYSAQTGRTEVLHGVAHQCEGGVDLALTSTAVGNDDRIEATRPLFRLGGDALEVLSWLTLTSASGREQHHTTMRLRRG